MAPLVSRVLRLNNYLCEIRVINVERVSISSERKRVIVRFARLAVSRSHCLLRITAAAIELQIIYFHDWKRKKPRNSVYVVCNVVCNKYYTRVNNVTVLSSESRWLRTT